MLTVVALPEGIYLAVLRDPGGGLLCRLVGPAGWVLEQLAGPWPRNDESPRTGEPGGGE